MADDYSDTLAICGTRMSTFSAITSIGMMVVSPFPEVAHWRKWRKDLKNSNMAPHGVSDLKLWCEALSHVLVLLSQVYVNRELLFNEGCGGLSNTIEYGLFGDAAFASLKLLVQAFSNLGLVMYYYVCFYKAQEDKVGVARKKIAAQSDCTRFTRNPNIVRCGVALIVLFFIVFSSILVGAIGSLNSDGWDTFGLALGGIAGVVTVIGPLPQIKTLLPGKSCFGFLAPEANRDKEWNDIQSGGIVAYAVLATTAARIFDFFWTTQVQHVDYLTASPDFAASILSVIILLMLVRIRWGQKQYSKYCKVAICLDCQTVSKTGTVEQPEVSRTRGRSATPNLRGQNAPAPRPEQSSDGSDDSGSSSDDESRQHDGIDTVNRPVVDPIVDPSAHDMTRRKKVASGKTKLRPTSPPQ